MKEIVLGMAHRGRLNVLTPGDGQAAPRHLPRVQGRLGRARRRRRLGRREVPSRRLVGPRVRRQQGAPVADRQPVASRDRRPGRAWARRAPSRTSSTTASASEIVPLEERVKVLPLLIHGDAAFAGQGVIAEMLRPVGPARPSRRPARCISSSTTRSASPPTRRFSRSSPYPSDVAKMIEAPIFHVNGDDPEAVVYAAKIATEFRMKFHKPVVSTCSATAASATTRATSRRSRSR